MLDLAIFERFSPETLSRDQLDTALSGLTQMSRSIIRDELVRAQLDTTMEYHRAQAREIKVQLAYEIQCLNALIASCIRVNDEFQDLKG